MEIQTGRRFSNWAETYSCTPELYCEPSTVDEILEVLERAKKNRKCLKVAGWGHSPSDIACTSDYMLCMKNFKRVIDVRKWFVWHWAVPCT
jgi:L-gulonolactone oxidase